MWAGAIAILAYLLSPIVTVSVLRKLFRDTTPFITLVGMAVGPLLVALIQFFLFYILPGQVPWVYPVVIGVFFVGLAIWSREFVFLKRFVWPRPTLSVSAIYVGLVVTFVLIRMVVYPPSWGDVIQYQEQRMCIARQGIVAHQYWLSFCNYSLCT